MNIPSKQKSYKQTKQNLHIIKYVKHYKQKKYNT